MGLSEEDAKVDDDKAESILGDDDEQDEITEDDSENADNE
jgi:hypothetical protein